MINDRAIPFLKILFPYLLGLIFALNIGVFKQLHLLFCISFIALVLSFLLQKYTLSALSGKKKWFIFCTHVFLFLSAFEAIYVYNDKHASTHYSHYTYTSHQSIILKVTDIPSQQGSYVKVPARVLAVKYHNTWHYTTGKSILYLKNDSLKRLHVGNTLFLNAKFRYVDKPKNPGEFDYRNFLERKNIFHVLYSHSGKYAVIPKLEDDFSIVQLGANIKSKIVSVLKENGLNQASFSICSALLVGYDDEIDNDIMQRFSHSGTLHVLSVSGMHTGILYAILVFLVGLVDKQNTYKKLTCFFIITSLFLFVCITGFSPSVLRAAIMLSLIVLGKTIYKQGNSYNTLLLSAFILLLTNPYLILDIGFLLSYLAVFGIMYLYPILYRRYVIENKIIRWLWSLTLMSVCATVFTLPVSLYFFHQFPMWFVLANLVVIPVSTLLMLLSALFIVTYKIFFIKKLFVFLINLFTNFLLWVTSLTDQKSIGYVDDISFSTLDLMLCFSLLLITLMILHTKNYKSVMAFGFVCIVWLGNSIYTNYVEAQGKELVIFHINKKSAFAFREGKNVYGFWDKVIEKEFQRAIKPYLVSFSHLNVFSVKTNLLIHQHQCILHVTKSINMATVQHPNYIIISHNTPMRFLSNYNIKPVIIADCSNSDTFVKKLRQECLKHDLSFYSVKEKGAIQLSLNE